MNTAMKEHIEHVNRDFGIALRAWRDSYEVKRITVKIASWTIPSERWAYLFDDPETKTRCKVIWVDREQGRLTARFESEEGAEIPEHAHTRDELIRCVSGRVTMHVAELNYTLGPGSSILVPAGTAHSGLCHKPTIVECDYFLGQDEVSEIQITK